MDLLYLNPWRSFIEPTIRKNMEKIYQTKKNKCKLVSAKPETIKFLLDYSKSLKVTEAKGMQFDSNLN